MLETIWLVVKIGLGSLLILWLSWGFYDIILEKQEQDNCYNEYNYNKNAVARRKKRK